MWRIRLQFLALVVIALLLVLDQGSKAWVRAEIPLYRASGLVPHLIDLTHVENRGVSFSFLGNLGEGVRVPLLVSISLAALAVLGIYWRRHWAEMPLLGHLGFVLILPGAAGNLIDRMRYGTVTDFLHFRFYDVSFFVNNLADIFISAGVIAYALGMLRPQRPR